MHASLPYRAAAPVAIAGMAVLVLAGCSSSGSGSSSTTGAAASTVTIIGAQSADEAKLLTASWADFAKKNNITINFSSDQNFAANVVTKIKANAVPDIAFFPQVGLLSAAVGTGKIAALSGDVQSELTKNFSKDWQSLVTVKGKQYAVPLDASVKGYIWYSPSDFKKWGITVPKTYQEMLDDTAKIQAATGKPPWCAGFGSGDATGWPGSDQLAEVVLGSAGPKVYDDWVAGKVKFTDAPIDNAFTQLGKILQNDKFVNAGFGGPTSITGTAFGDVAAKLADGTCALTNQATFLEGNLASTKTAAGSAPKIAPDGDIWAFLMPGEKAGQNSVMGGGDFAAAFNTNAATQKVLAYLGSAEFANNLVSASGSSFISPNKGVDASKVTDPLLADATKLLQSSDTTFRFGAGDSMPSVVQKAFWKGMSDWTNGTDQKTVQANIQNSWASVTQ